MSEVVAELDRLYDEEDKLHEKLNDTNNRYNNAQSDEEKVAIREEGVQIYQDLYVIWDKMRKLKEKIYLDIPPIKTDGVIDLRKDKVTKVDILEDSYDIYLHGTDQVIGNITYFGYHTSYNGDIGYSIYPPYNGHHYAYRALCLMSELLYEHDIKEFWVSVKNTNIPSIKTIERYGVVPFREIEDFVVYQGTTAKREEITAGVKM